ncbi:SHOCT domain-containing protein [Actinopolymorpha alba]|uniref:SHOCT domain-containing protein n=1 Tax=Actinopolymorpha alba TaxID=533267 RepID=UPI0003725C25|nr:SHOCT domain-containing protein [Actinopolymorpha alba]
MDYPLLGAFFTMLWFFLWILWIFLLVRIIIDIFRSQDLGGWGKAGWLLLVLILPFLGVFVYVVARGRSMGERDLAQASKQEQAFQEYVRTTARIPSQADELTKLAQLKNQGHISEAEYEQAKTRLLAG